MDFIRRFFDYIAKVAAYARILWDDFDWDWHFILILLRYKIARTRKCLKSNNILSDVDDVCHQMRVAETLIDRILANDYCRVEWDNHNAKWGELKDHLGKQHRASVEHILYREKAITDEEKEIERRESRRIWQHEELMASQDLDYLFKFLRKHLITWWD